MPQFPKSQAEVITLCQKMIAGFTINTVLYPSPPETPAELTTFLNAALAARDAAMASAAVTGQLYSVSDDKFDDLRAAMRSDIKYAELIAPGDGPKLQTIGWDARSSSSNTPPNQPRSLEVIEQGSDWVSLDWKNPAGGTRVSAYKMQRREMPAGDWTDVGTALDSEGVLQNQPKGKDLEYRVLALNGAGASIPSNTVAVVL